MYKDTTSKRVLVCMSVCIITYYVMCVYERTVSKCSVVYASTVGKINVFVHEYGFQVMGQLGSCDAPTEGLSAVRARARQFLKDTHIPIMAPMNRVMPAPGSELKTSIDTKIGFQGGTRVCA